MSLILKKDKIYVAGHNGLVGSAILRLLDKKGYSNIIVRSHSQLNLLDNESVREFFNLEKPEVVFLAAARVGGIFANNTYRADFIYENMQIQNNVIWCSHKNNVHRLIFLGSSCIYPKLAVQPIKELSLLTGSLEYSNQPYAIAKISGLELINGLRKQHGRDYFSAMPTNLFGINDNFHPENSHVLASLIRKFSEAKQQNKKQVIIWGDGTPLREFMYCDDLASALVFIAENISYFDLERSEIGKNGLSHINIGSGYEISIKELSLLIANIFGYEGGISFDQTKPNGTPRKLMDSSFLVQFGWKSEHSFEKALRKTIEWYKTQGQ
jgi:GDP-L-fucose synthase